MADDERVLAERMTLRRIVTLRVVLFPAVTLTLVLSVFAVLVGMQTGATEPAAQAHARLQQTVSAAAGVPLVPDEEQRSSGGPCTWFGLGWTQPTGQVRPEFRASGMLPVGGLDGIAARLDGWQVTRSESLLAAEAPSGDRLDVRVADGVLRLTAEAPCVWEEGVRRR